SIHAKNAPSPAGGSNRKPSASARSRAAAYAAGPKRSALRSATKLNSSCTRRMYRYLRFVRAALFDPSDHSRRRHGRKGARRLLERNDQRISDAHVERAVPLFVRKVAAAAELGEDRRHGPTSLFEDRL